MDVAMDMEKQNSVSERYLWTCRPASMSLTLAGLA